jgi:hypothetical protein
VRQQLGESPNLRHADLNPRSQILRRQLIHKFPAPPTRRNWLTVLSDRDTGNNLRLSLLKHIGNRSVLGTKADATGRVDAHTSEYFACVAEDRSSDSTRRDAALCSKLTDHSSCGGN